MAVLADLLTASRVAVAAALLATPASRTAVLLVAWAWLSDSLDGSLARRASRQTRLGELDRLLDAAVGVGIAWYLVDQGFLPGPVTFLATCALLALWALTRVLAAQMLLLALLNAAMIAWAFTTSPLNGQMLVATAVVVLLIERRRFVQELVPGFLGGLSELARRGRRRSVP